MPISVTLRLPDQREFLLYLGQRDTHLITRCSSGTNAAFDVRQVALSLVGSGTRFFGAGSCFFEIGLRLSDLLGTVGLRISRLGRTCSCERRVCRRLRASTTCRISASRRLTCANSRFKELALGRMHRVVGGIVRLRAYSERGLAGPKPRHRCLKLSL